LVWIKNLAVSHHSDDFSNEHCMQAKIDHFDQPAFKRIGNSFTIGALTSLLFSGVSRVSWNLSYSLPDTMPTKSASLTYFTEGIFTVNALVCLML